MRKRKRNLRSWILEPFTENGALQAPDYVLLSAAGIAIILGLLMLSSATSIISFERTQDSYAFVFQQITRGLIPGLILFFITIRINYKKYKKYAWLLFILMILSLTLVFIPGLGLTLNGVSSWVSVGAITFQPSEIAKLIFILWLSAWLTARSKSIKNFRTTTIPFVIFVTVVCGLLMLQPDTGTMMLFAAVALVLFLSANANLLHVALLIAGGVLATIPFILAAPYRLQRLLTFWNPEADIQGSGYQVYQALLAIGSGSWFGVGIGQSRQKFYYLPEIASDSIFAIIGEELGFILSALFIILFFIIFLRGLRVAKRADSQFGTLVALGITFLITFQMLINVGSMLGILPLTGLPLPFVSLGGTNLAVLLAAIGILTNISRHQIQSNE